MRFPDDVVILRPQATDAYGNPGSSFVGAQQIPSTGFLVTPERLLMPATADLRDGDRVRVNGTTYRASVTPVRSPAKRVLWDVAVEELPL
jgi:hypothetical protein